MRVLLFHSAVAEDARADDLDTLTTAQTIAEVLNRSGHHAALAPFGIDPDAVRRAVREAGAEIIFNLVESVLGRDSLAVTAPMIFETLGVAFTGSRAGSMALAGDKPLAKSILRAAGLPTPDWAVPPAWDGLVDGAPYIVKSATEDASLALDDFSIANTRQSIVARAEDCTRQYGGCWFAEGFVEGREFNVALIEEQLDWRVLPIAEMHFENWPDEKPRIVGYQAKWDADSREARDTKRSFGWEGSEPALAKTLAELACRACRLMELGGYARVDFRVDADGSPTILEVNPNPCLAPDAGFAAAAAQAGWSYAAMIERILAVATRS